MVRAAATVVAPAVTAAVTAATEVAPSPVISDHQSRTFLNKHAFFAWQLLGICLNAAVNNDKVNHKKNRYKYG